MSLNEVYAGRGVDGKGIARLDIIAIHGLNPLGKENHTWETATGRLWLRDAEALPSKLPYVRTLLYKYNSSPAFGTDKKRFVDQANTLLEYIRLDRGPDCNRPLILIGHSLGGILIKQALVNAQANPKYGTILQKVVALAFFGTPHAGPTESAKVKFGKACVSIVQAIPGNASNDIMQALKHGSLFSDILQEGWRHQLERYNVVSFYEGIGDLVPRESAVLGLPGDRENQVSLMASHRNMCRFDPSVEQDRRNYFLVEGNIVELCMEALAAQDRLGQISRTENLREVQKYLKNRCLNPRFEEVEVSHEETLKWLWNTDQPNPGFVDWLLSSEGLFWISGRPGSGKSTLMKHTYRDPRTIRYLRTKCPSIVLGKFFFYEQGNAAEKSFRGLLESVLDQALKAFPDLISGIYESYQNAKLVTKSKPGSDEVLTQADLERMVLYISRQKEVSGHMCLFIDALDECHGDHRREVKFLTDLVDPARENGIRFRICISSRPEPHIQLQFRSFSGLEVHKWSAKDIEDYVTERLTSTIKLLAGDCEIQRETSFELVNSVVEKSSGVFLWVTLVVNELIEGLEEGDNDKELFERLEALPPDIETLYERIIDKIPAKFLHDTVYYFRLILEGPRHLPMLKFCLAVDGPEVAIGRIPGSLTEDQKQTKCNSMKRRLQSRARGLIDSDGDVVTLLHRSIKEWALRTNALERILERSTKKSHPDVNGSFMAMYLQLLKDQDEQLLKDVENAVRLDFGEIKDFFDWARNAENTTQVSQTRLINSLDKYCTTFDSIWHEKYISIFGVKEPATEGAWKSNLLSVAVVEGLAIYLKEALEIQHINIRKDGRPLLHDAVSRTTLYHQDPNEKRAQLECFRLLLKNGALPNQDFEDDTAWQILIGGCLTAGERWSEALHLFLDYEADPNVQLNYNFGKNTLLYGLIENWRYWCKQESERVEVIALVRKVLTCGADPNLKGDNEISALELAQQQAPEIARVIEEFQTKGKTKQANIEEASSMERAGDDQGHELVARGGRDD